MLMGSAGCSHRARHAHGLKTAFRVMPNTMVEYTFFGERFFAPEIDEICVSNSTLSFDDYLECRLYDLTTEMFYNNAMFDELYKFVERKGVLVCFDSEYS